MASGWEQAWGTGQFAWTNATSGGHTFYATYTPHFHTGVFQTSGTCSGSGTVTGDVYYQTALKITDTSTNTVLYNSQVNVWSATGFTCSGSGGSFLQGIPSYYTVGAQTTATATGITLTHGDTFEVFLGVGGSGDVQITSGNSQYGNTLITMNNATGYNDYIDLNSYTWT